MQFALIFAVLTLLQPQAEGAPELPVASFEDFEFTTSWESPCFANGQPQANTAEECSAWSEPQYFHGVWHVGFETSNFTFMGRMECYERSCIDLKGSVLPWPDRYDCNRKFEVKFVGRRSLHPQPGHLGTPIYAVEAEKLISARKLPDPYNWVCPFDELSGEG